MSGMLMIGATGRKLGKTLLACRLLEHFGRRAELVGVKVTPIDPESDCCPAGGTGCGVCSSLEGPFDLVSQTDRSGDKDTARLLAAGAAEVLWLRVRREALSEGLSALRERLAGRLAVCESNSLRTVVEPDVFLLVRGLAGQPFKDSARAVRPLADRVVRLQAGEFDFDLGEIVLRRGRWSMPVEAGGILLAGGASRRMGSDKSMLDVGGRPLIVTIVDQLRGWLREVVISSNQPDKLAFLQLPVVSDAEPGQGPLMGIASALRVSSCEHNLVVACDIPRIDRALARHMLQLAAEADVVVPIDSAGRLEPLFAVYRRAMAETMFQALASGQRRIPDAFGHARVIRVALEPEEQLANLNTRADLQAFLKEIG